MKYEKNAQYTPAQIESTITRLAERYGKWYNDYRWALAHPQQYTADDINQLASLRDVTYSMMQTIIPEFVDDDIKAMVEASFAEAVKKHNPTLKVKLARWIARWIKKIFKK